MANDEGFLEIDALCVNSFRDSASSRLFFEFRDNTTLSITMDTWVGVPPCMRHIGTLAMTADMDAATKMRDWLNKFLAVAGSGSGKEEDEVGSGGNE